MIQQLDLVKVSLLTAAKDQRVQRIVIGAVVGGLVGYAVGKLAVPYIFRKEEKIEIIPFDHSEPERLEDLPPAIYTGHEAGKDVIGKVEKIERVDGELLDAVSLSEGSRVAYRHIAAKAAAKKKKDEAAAPEKKEQVAAPEKKVIKSIPIPGPAIDDEDEEE